MATVFFVVLFLAAVFLVACLAVDRPCSSTFAIEEPLSSSIVLATLFFVVLLLVAVFLVAFLAVDRRPDVVASERLVLFRVPFLLFDARFAGWTSLFRGLKRSNIS